MRSNTKKYSPVKILAVLFSLLLIVEIAIKYFSSSSVRFLRLYEVENEPKTPKEGIITNNKSQYAINTQLNFYDRSTRFDSSTSILSYINDNCNYCINTLYFEDYYHKYCPYQPSDLKQDDYCQYLYVKLINEYSFSTLLTSLITLISGKMNSLKVTINNQRNVSFPPNSKCFRIEKSSYSVAHHTPKSFEPQKKSTLPHYTSPRDKIKIRMHNMNLLYKHISETQQYLNERYKSISIFTGKNLICINTRSKEPLTIDFRTLLMHINANLNDEARENQQDKDKNLTINQDLASTNDIPNPPNKNDNIHDISNKDNKLSLILHLLLSGSTTNWVVNLIMTLVKGSLIFYLINIIKVIFFLTHRIYFI